MKARTLVALSVLVLATGVAHGQGPVGLLSMVSGNVQVVRAGQKTPAPARTADLVGPGDRVLTGPKSEASFLFCPETRAGKILADSDVLFDAGALQVKKGKLGEERKVPTCKLPANLMLASASQQQSGMVRLRGAQLLLRSPAKTNIAHLTPVFRWDAMDNAKLYEVKVMDREERTLWRHTVSGTEAQYPADAKPLAYGQKYWWRVTARDGEDTISEMGSFFQVLPGDQADAIRNTEAGLRKGLADSPADNGPRFLLAFMYEENGMLDAALRVYAELSDKMGPQDWVQARQNELMIKLGWDRLDTAPPR